MPMFQVQSLVLAHMIPSPGTYRRQPIDASLSYWCFSPFLSLWKQWERTPQKHPTKRQPPLANVAHWLWHTVFTARLPPETQQPLSMSTVCPILAEATAEAQNGKGGAPSMRRNLPQVALPYCRLLIMSSLGWGGVQNGWGKLSIA